MKKTFAIALLILTPVFTFASIDKDLKSGMKNDSVREMQQILFNKGYLSKSLVTGTFGNLTLKAVKKYQSDNKLASTGLVGPLTRGLMNKSNSISTVATTTINKAPVIELSIPVQQPQQSVDIKKDTIDYDSLVDFSTMDPAKADEYVRNAIKNTGISYQFLLKFLKANTQQNKGKCYLTDSTKGLLSDGLGVIKPSRDLQPFFTITNNLGLDFYKVAVSCDGTIGSFTIPSNWMMLNKNFKPFGLLNPWNPQDVATMYAQYLISLNGFKNGVFDESLTCRMWYGGSSKGVCPFDLTSTDVPLTTINNDKQIKINTLKQQILDVTQKYNQDVSDAQNNPNWSSDTGRGWVKRYTDEYNAKISQLNLQIQQLQLNN